MTSVAQEIWNKCLEQHLKPQLNELNYRTWFEPAEPMLNGERDFILITPNKLSCDYLQQYSSLIKTALVNTCGREFNLEISIRQKASPRADEGAYARSILDLEDKERVAGLGTATEETTLDASKIGDHRVRLNPNYRFDSFIVGPTNHFAHAAATAVATMQGGQHYNPLFLYGGSGLGKTHLMQAIGNQVRAEHPEKKVVYVQTEQFVNQFIQVIQNKHFDLFRRKYREADLLLIDDIQFLEGKEQMQEEFFHTFNALYENHKNIVITCDQPPQTLSTLSERLKTRFNSGLIVDIEPPEYETRMAILRRLSHSQGIVIPSDVCEYIAQNFASNIRELEGAFKNLMAYSLLNGPIDLEMARKALSHNLQQETAQRIDAEHIMQLVSHFYHVPATDLAGKLRSQDIVVPRQVAMYLCRTVIDLTYNEIGAAFGGRNHSTVMHACERVKEALGSETQLKHDVAELQARLET